jgi:hypothetical protein
MYIIKIKTHRGGRMSKSWAINKKPINKEPSGYRRGFIDGCKEKQDDVLKLIDELQSKYPINALILDKLKGEIKDESKRS